MVVRHSAEAAVPDMKDMPPNHALQRPAIRLTPRHSVSSCDGTVSETIPKLIQVQPVAPENPAIASLLACQASLARGL